MSISEQQSPESPAGARRETPNLKLAASLAGMAGTLAVRRNRFSRRQAKGLFGNQPLFLAGQSPAVFRGGSVAPARVGNRDRQLQGGFAGEVFVLTMLAMMARFVMDLWAIAWAAMWTGIWARKSNEGLSSAVVRVLLLPWLMLGVIATAMSLSAFYLRTPQFGFGFYLVLWFVLGALNDCGWVSYSRRRLLSEFRLLATPYGEERIGLLGRFGRFLGTLLARRSARAVRGS